MVQGTPIYLLKSGVQAPIGDPLYLSNAISGDQITISEFSAAYSTLLTGAGNYIVPENVHLLEGIAVGAGANGGGVGVGAAASATSGSPGSVVKFSLKVTEGQVIAYSAGAQPIVPVVGNVTAADAADTTFGAVLAKGGKGGVGSASGNAASPSTTAVLNSLAAEMAIIPTVDLSVEVLVSTGAAGTAGNGGVARTTGYGVSGIGGVNAAGSAATGYGQAGGGASSTAGGGADLAGGRGTPGCIMLKGYS